MNVKELRQNSGMSQVAFAKYFEISRRNVENWEVDPESPNYRECPAHLLKLMHYKLEKEGLLNDEKSEED